MFEPVFLFVLGLFIGSFLGVLADRLPKGEDVVRGRSHCDFCKKPLRWFELIPVFSFVFQQGKCLRCSKKLSVKYPLIELATGLGFAGVTTSADWGGSLDLNGEPGHYRVHAIYSY